MSQPTTRGVRFAPSIPGGLRALAESHIPARGRNVSEVIRSAVTDYLETPTDLAALEAGERRLVALRMPAALGARLDARAAADTDRLRRATGNPRARAVSRTDVVIAALSALDQR